MSRLFKKLANLFTDRLVPNAIKRMIVMTSITNIDNKPGTAASSEALDNFRSYFKLSSSNNSMRFAIEVGNYLWHDIQNRWDEVKTHHQELVDEIYGQCPPSLRYAEPEKMKKDILAVLDYLRKHHPEAFA